MLAIIVNAIAVLVGSSVGLLFRRGIPEKIKNAIMTAIGIATMYIGITGALKGENTVACILSLVFGVSIGTALNIDGGLNKLSLWAEKKFDKKGEKGSFAKGLVTATLLFSVGAMALVGSLNAGITKDNTLLYTKSILDMISSAVLIPALGIGVAAAVIPMTLYQGIIVLLSGVIAPILSDAMINEMTCVGSLIIILLSLNLLGIGKFKVADFLPAIILAPLFSYLCSFLPI